MFLIYNTATFKLVSAGMNIKQLLSNGKIGKCTKSWQSCPKKLKEEKF